MSLEGLAELLQDAHPAAVVVRAARRPVLESIPATVLEVDSRPVVFRREADLQVGVRHVSLEAGTPREPDPTRWIPVHDLPPNLDPAVLRRLDEPAVVERKSLSVVEE